VDERERARVMILLTRINGEAFALNPDLIERVEETPDTHITLVDGKHLMVAESLKDVIDAIRRDRAAVLALASEVADEVIAADDPEDPNVVPLTTRR
jgi:flagellar protein FlbD|tara:strand:- start:57 stop:347 length:291 start_codon:yes stop_codon:yes gene_type:complete